MLGGNALGRALVLRHKLEKACALLARPLETGQSRIGHSTHPRCAAFVLQDLGCHLHVFGQPHEDIAEDD